MKLKILSKQMRKLRTSRAELDKLKWHVHFAWLPVRFDDYTVVWLERVARRRTLADSVVTRVGPFAFIRRPIQYGPITNVLTQPGVIQDGCGESVSAAQASCAPVQSGSAAALGLGGKGVLGPGTAHVISSSPGGFNTPPPQPGP